MLYKVYSTLAISKAVDLVLNGPEFWHTYTYFHSLHGVDDSETVGVVKPVKNRSHGEVYV